MHGQSMNDDETIALTRSTPSAEGIGDLMVPKRIGSLQLIRSIGRGGMGVVYLGRDEMLGRDVAVKFLLNAVSGTDDPGFKRFLEGARAAAAVRHPGLTTIHQAELIQDIPYLVMEFIDGPTLRQVLERNGPLGAGPALAVMDAVTSAIGALHDRGIVHRDIKPSNVLLDFEGGVYVTDFGLTCDRASLDADSTVPSTAGTPAYMAPEVFDGVVSARSDVYALGVMLYQLLTGELPFAGSKRSLPKQHADQPLSLEPLRDAKVDERMIEVLQRAMHKNAMFRYKSATHFLRALKDTCSDPGAISTGFKELAVLVGRTRDARAEKVANEPGSTGSSSYFDRLATLADEKRRKREGDTPPETVGRDESTASDIQRSRFVTDDLPCVRCRQNLRGLPVDDKCPGCDTPIATSQWRKSVSATGESNDDASPRTPTVPEDAILFDAECANCGYNLRMLSARTGNCPECGMPNAANTELFTYLDWRESHGPPDEMKRRVRSAKLIVWLIVVAIVILFLVVVSLR